MTAPTRRLVLAGAVLALTLAACGNVFDPPAPATGPDKPEQQKEGNSVTSFCAAHTAGYRVFFSNGYSALSVVADPACKGGQL